MEELSAAPSTDRAAPDEAPDEAPAPIDVLITRGAGAASGGPMPEARVEPMGDAADAPRQGPLPEPTAGLLDAGIDDLMEDEREITSGDPYESLGAMPSEGAVQRRVDQLRDEVDSLARGYRQVADGTSDPAVAAEALHRAASLYDHIGSIPLHAPTDDLRRELIPWSSYTTIAELTAACDVWFQKTGREITLEYTLMGGVNDSVEQAQRLAAITKRMRANVNLIRYNEVDGLPFKRPADGSVRTFQEVLREKGVSVHIRASRGRDIAAACGQLRHEKAGAV